MPTDTLDHIRVHQLYCVTIDPLLSINYRKHENKCVANILYYIDKNT